MNVPAPDGPDVNQGTNVFIACWVLTGIVGVVLIFRFGVKAWIQWVLPKVAAPPRVWGLEDFFFLLGFAFDVGHMSLIQKSWNWGLGRHFFYLTPVEKVNAMKWDFISQPLAVSASMFSRTGTFIFLYFCFGTSPRLRLIVTVCMIIQFVANMVTILQIFLQCGPNPYYLTDRAAFFHYMWDPLPADGSVICQDPSVQATVGYVQGAFNSLVDFVLAGLSAYELWQFMFRGSSSGKVDSLVARFRRLDSQTRNRRLWQTAILSGPLVLSAVASIVKTKLLSVLGQRLDFTWNIVPFLLWVKIENYCIPLAACGAIIRLFSRTFAEKKQHDDPYYSNSGRKYGSGRNNLSKSGHVVELSSRISRSKHTESKSFGHLAGDDDVEDGLSGRTRHGSEDRIVDEQNTDIMVKREYEVRVEEDDHHHHR